MNHYQQIMMPIEAQPMYQPGFQQQRHQLLIQQQVPGQMPHVPQQPPQYYDQQQQLVFAPQAQMQPNPNYPQSYTIFNPNVPNWQPPCKFYLFNQKFILILILFTK